jgi:hypothetical protein
VRRVLVVFLSSVLGGVVLAVPAASDEPQPRVSLQMGISPERCESPDGVLVPPPVRVTRRLDGVPVPGVELVWSRHPTDSGGAATGPEVVVGAATTDAAGRAVLVTPPEPITAQTTWKVTFAGDAERTAVSGTSRQVRLGIDRLREYRSQGYSGPSRSYGSDLPGALTREGYGPLCPWEPASGVTLSVGMRDAGSSASWTTIGTTTTDVAGEWSVPLLSPALGKQAYRASVTSDEGSDSSQVVLSSSVEVTPVHSGILKNTRPPVVVTGLGKSARLGFTVRLTHSAASAGLRRGAALWFRDRNANDAVRKVADLPEQPFVDGAITFSPTVSLTRSGEYWIEYPGGPVDQPSSGDHFTTVQTVDIRPWISAWPSKPGTVSRTRVLTRTMSIEPIQGPRMTVALLEKSNLARHSPGYKIVKRLKPNAQGKYVVTLPQGWKGTRRYRVFAGVLPPYAGYFEDDPESNEYSLTKAWTVTRK